MLAFQAGIIHRDISEGNITIVNGRGFLHDFDYGFNWKLFLQFLDFQDFGGTRHRTTTISPLHVKPKIDIIIRARADASTSLTAARSTSTP